MTESLTVLVEIFLAWMYTRELSDIVPCGAEEMRAWEICTVKAYALSNRIQARGFLSAVLQTLV